MALVRQATMADAEAISVLMTELGYPSTLEKIASRMNKMLSNPMYCTIVAELDGKVIGMINLRTVHSYISDNVGAQVSTIITKSEFRGKGVGKKLMYHGEQWAKEQGAQGLLLNSGIKKEREDAHQFYEKIGFTNTGYRFSKKIT